MDPSLIADRWPGEPAIIVSARRDGEWRTVATHGDLDAVRPWASVTKLVVALAAAVELDAGRARLDEPLGPAGATLAHLLSHASGLGFEAGDPVTEPGTKRIYSNVGFDLAAAHLAGAHVAASGDLGSWLDERVVTPLALSSTRLDGRASQGVVGSTNDLATFVRQWVSPTLIAPTRRDDCARAFLPALAGVVPGFGRFDPCPWGLGVEIRGEKRHWMGEWPAASFGHFGRSGALALVNVDEAITVVATSTVEFGAWAHDLWPEWTSAVRELALAS